MELHHNLLVDALSILLLCVVCWCCFSFYLSPTAIKNSLYYEAC